MTKEFRLIIAGGREFNDYDLLKRKCDHILSNKVKQGYKIVIISSKARGADLLGERYAKEKGYTIADFPPNWGLGKSAGYVRNKEMASFALESKNNGCICFWDNISKGTKHMIDISNSLKIPLRIINY